MYKPKINIQDQFLNVVRKEKVKVEVKLVTGERLQGFIRSFDNFCLVLEDESVNLLYKHAIAAVTLTGPVSGMSFGREEDH